VFGISAATWVLPDGPLLAALLGGAICLIVALDAQGRTAWSWWLGAGACAGLALCSKYSAALAIIGLVLFLLTEPRSRHWLMQPHPYAAGLLALAIFLPVLIWNAEHEWVSFLFQGSRANGAFHALGLVSTLAGGAAYLLPWIWAPLIICGFIAVRRGPHDRERWLLVCLALAPIVVFAAAAPWGNVLFHWAAPGYLMLLPLLGDAIARHWRDSRLVRSWLTATGAFVVVGVTLFASNVKFNWLPSLIGDVRLGRDASVGAVDWTSLRRDFAERGFLKRPGLVVAALRWSDAAKIDYALGGSVPVICLCRDAREYGLIARHDDYVGADVLIVARSTFEKMIGQCRPLFDALDPIAPAIVTHVDRPALELPLFLGHRLHAPADDGCAF
jgi:4-amino-4-deoxy-L-arabinose transferase-like glycosyltransferase